MNDLALRVARAHRLRRAATPSEVLSGLSDAVARKARLLRPSGGPERWRVGEYTVLVDRTGKDVRLACTCDFWVYQGPEYHAIQGGYLLGRPRGTAARPEQRDPRNRNRVCKHAAAVLTQMAGG